MSTFVSLELVPRSRESLIADGALAAKYPMITHINVPDLERFPIRSVDAVKILRAEFGDRFLLVPHIRAVAPAIHEDEFPGDIALIVQGDIPIGFNARVHVSTLEYIVEFARTHVSTLGYIAELDEKMIMMAGLDPYRSAIFQEEAYVFEKIRAGVKGFFTQPFFSLSHIAYWDELMPDECSVFYGIAPVITQGSLSYWRDKNNVVFPRDFALDFEWQVKFAQKVIRFASAHQRSVYLMPIRVPLAKYLEGIFEK